jgi:hypothetical protein
MPIRMPEGFQPRTIAWATDAGLALVFLFAWLAPVEKPPGLVPALAVVLIAEGYAIGSGWAAGILLTSNQKRVVVVIALIVLTGIFVYNLVGFGRLTGFWWPITAVILIQTHRLLDFLLIPDPGGGRGRAVMQGALAGFVIYCAVVLVAGAFLAARIIGPDPSSAFGIRQVVAVGFFYYALMAWSASRNHGWLAPLFTPPRRKR